MRNLLLTLMMMALMVGSVSAQTDADRQLTYGDVVTGEITDDAPAQEWTFQGNAGDDITILLEGDGNLDTLVRLLDADGNLLTENDDASELTLDSAIEAFVLTADGTYTIVATRFGEADGATTGTYQLTLALTGDLPEEEDAALEPDETAETDLPALTDGDGILTVGILATGTLDNDNPEDLWLLEGEEGDLITIEMENVEGNLDSTLTLNDTVGNELAFNDDRDNLSFDAAIVGFELPYTGEYIVIAGRFNGVEGTTTGVYELRVSAADEATSSDVAATPETDDSAIAPSTESETTTAPSTDLLAYGNRINATLDAAQTQEFRIIGRANDQITISVKRADDQFDPLVTLAGTDGTVIGVSDEFNGTADARLDSVTLPENGEYILRVTAETGGAYSLYIFQGAGTPAISPSDAAVTPPTSDANGSDAPETDTAEEAVSDEAEPESDTSDDTAAEEETATDASDGSESAAAEDEDAVSVVTETVDLGNVVLAITLTWDSSSDLDIAVTDPDGALIDYISTSSASGGQFGDDANSACNVRFETPSESVFWEVTPPTGTYIIDIAYVRPCEDRGAESFTVMISLDGEVVETFEGELNEGNLVSYEWTLEE